MLVFDLTVAKVAEVAGFSGVRVVWYMYVQGIWGYGRSYLYEQQCIQGLKGLKSKVMSYIYSNIRLFGRKGERKAVRLSRAFNWTHKERICTRPFSKFSPLSTICSWNMVIWGAEIGFQLQYGHMGRSDLRPFFWHPETPKKSEVSQQLTIVMFMSSSYHEFTMGNL